ncbi:MAG: S8 family serine peptidase [Phycisphaerales bacterium]
MKLRLSLSCLSAGALVTLAISGPASLAVASSSAASAAGVLVEASFALRENVDDTAKLRGDLADILAAAQPDELIPISIVMTRQADRDVINRAYDLPKAERRAYVRSVLEPLARQSQTRLLAYLNNQQVRGNVDARINALWIHNVVGTAATPDVIRAIARRRDVAWINNDAFFPGVLPVEPADVPGDAGNFGAGPLGGNIECGVNLMGAPQVWNELSITGEGVVVGVIDTGCCITHPDLANQIWTNPGETPGNGIDDDGNGYVDDVHGWSFDNNGSSQNISDSNGHGTHVSGTVAGDGTNGTTTGMAPNAAIMTIKFWNNFSGELSVWNGMEYGVDNGADVLTASLGWPHGRNPDRVVWRTVCENSIAAGVVVTYAAGNEGSCCPPFDHVRTPGDVPLVITVGATDCNDVIAGFSSRGPVTWQGIQPWDDFPYPPGKIKPSISAPGVNTTSTWRDCTGYVNLSGTSMATPHVAGAIALILEANPDLDHQQVKQILMDTAIDLGVAGIDNTYGAGRVDAYAATVAALESRGGPADLIAFDFAFGSLISGDIDDLLVSDDLYVVARSQFGFLSSEPNILVLGVRADTELTTASTLDITLESRLNNPGGNVNVRLRNWDTGPLVNVHSYVLGTTEITKTVEDIPAAAYIRDHDGLISLSVKHVVIATFSVQGFVARFDKVEIMVN